MNFINSKKIIIQRKTYTQDTNGELIEVWSTHLQPYVSLQSRSGLKAIQNNIQDTLISYRFYCDPMDIKEIDRINDGGIFYEIKAVNDKIDHLEVDCLRMPK